MEVIILASGSKGNAISISERNTNLLVDIGISLQTLKTKFLDAKLDLNSYEYLLLTHEHSDHIKGLKSLLKYKPNIHIYLTKGTYNGLGNDVMEYLTNYTIIASDVPFNIEDIKITPFGLSHDANEPVGFVVENGKKIVIATDTGYIDRVNFELLKNADLYILEANHDTNMLMNSQRPFHLKKRIISEKGHLSNQDAALLIDKYISSKDETIWAVAHISEDCNAKLSIEKTVVNVLEDPTKIKLIFTSQETSKKIIL